MSSEIIDEMTNTLLYLRGEGVLDIEMGEEKKFCCPVCGASARAVRGRTGGHLHIACSSCDFFMCE